MNDHTTIKNVLVVAPNWLGDAVLALPAIAGVRKLFPASQITILGLQHICELFKESPYADERKIYSDTRLTRVSIIRKERFDLAILLPNSFRTALMVHLARIPLRCGYKRDGRGIMLNMAIKVDANTTKLPQTEYYMNIVNYIIQELANNDENTLPFKGRDGVGMGFSSEGENRFPPLLYLSHDEIQYANETLQNFNISPGSLIIGINPGAAYGSAKRWYPERFAQVSSALVNKHKAAIIIFGSKQELDIATEIENLSRVPVINMAGTTNIMELNAPLKHAR